MLVRAGLIAVLFGQAAGNFDPSTLRPFTNSPPYLGKFETGLYPGGKNEVPAAHRAAGLKIAAQIRPLDADGRPEDAEGKIIGLVFGHSNCKMYFTAFGNYLKGRASELHPRFELLNAAIGGNQLPEISRLQGSVWGLAGNLLSKPGYSPKQVQVLFLHTTYHGANNKGRLEPRPFPEAMEQMTRDLDKVLAHAVTLFPNLRTAYLTADGFRHFTGFEPHVWREAFAFKWLIEGQIKGADGTGFEGERRRLPWLCWGPYIWDNSWGREYFTDGVHPAKRSLEIFVEKYDRHLRDDPVAKNWLFR